jgi:hypothetical protein
LFLTALPFTFDGVTPAVSKAHAIIGRPLTPLSIAGVHRRAVRRTFGVGANLGYSGVYHRNFSPYAYNRLATAIIRLLVRPSMARPLTVPVGAAAGEVGAGIAHSMPPPSQPPVGATAIIRLLVRLPIARPLMGPVGAAAGEVGAGIAHSMPPPLEPPVGAAAGVGAAVGAGEEEGGGDRKAAGRREERQG